MKLARVLALSLALPVALAAQQPAPPTTDLMTFVSRTRTMGLQRNLATAFDSIPADKFSYKPTAPQQTLGYIAQHLANDNYFFCNNFGDLKATRPEEETATPDSVKATWPKEKLVASLKASFTFCEQAFAQLNDAALNKTYTVTQQGQSREVSRMSPVIGHLIDMADHYSQVANYMRLNNMLPPTALPRPRP